jgi:hypothetical protein
VRNCSSLWSQSHLCDRYQAARHSVDLEKLCAVRADPRTQLEAEVRRIVTPVGCFGLQDCSRPGC